MQTFHWQMQKRIAKRLVRTLRDDLGVDTARLGKCTEAVARGFGYANSYPAAHHDLATRSWRDHRAADSLLATRAVEDRATADAALDIVRSRLGHLMA